MQSRLIVKNFGPIKEVDLDLRNVNVFIGPQASGKSALAKLFTIFKAPRKFLKNGNAEANLKAFKDVLEEYNIQSFLMQDSEVEYLSELHNLSYKNGTFSYVPKLLNQIKKIERHGDSLDNNREKIYNELDSLSKQYLMFSMKFRDSMQEHAEQDTVSTGYDAEKVETHLNITQTNFPDIIKAIKDIETELSTNAVLYIPSERNFINIVKNSALNLLLHKVPIPKHILLFGAELEKSSVNEIDLGFLSENLVYRKINGEDRIFTSTENSIRLGEAASGVQSAVPILLAVYNFDEAAINRHHSFVIEEPELNLFPEAQYELIKKLAAFRDEIRGGDWGQLHVYTTHSPYILSALNILLYTNKVEKFLIDKSNSTGEWYDVFNERHSINIPPNFFSAYQIKDGGAESIFNIVTGLISDNYIDEATDKMNDDFDALMNLMK
ncbi:MAG: AAA family ATPase [Taibaiella sp.]|nr:AAA family ATPase [Taibaiella sp.]